MRPFELLPMPMPADFDPSVDTPDFFYENFLKHFIPDMIRMMNVGLTIDDAAVDDLRKVIDEVLRTVEDRLKVNPLIIQFQQFRLPAAQQAHAAKATEAVRTVDHYMKEFKSSDILHRTWVVNTHLRTLGKSKDVRDKWTIANLKKYNIWCKDLLLQGICQKRTFTNENKAVLAGMKALAEFKVLLWNKPRYERAAEPVPVDSFNPGSNKQMREFFAMMKIPPLAFSKDTGEASWGRDQLVELKDQGAEGHLLVMLDACIDYSFSAIIKNNFIKAFDSFTIDGVLHGNIRLFGAKSCRNTSNSPNLLNAPSTRSIYAKPLKRCFKSPDGYVIYTADLKALEDRVIANLSGDQNKLNIFLEGIDGHSLNSCIYYADEIQKIMGVNTNNVKYVKEFYRLVEEEKNKTLDGIRFKSKAPTFKLAYGGFPDADKGGVITQEIFDNYHNVLYPGITKYRENYVLPTTRKNGYIHLGLGCKMYSSDPELNIRTLNNATVQFWSILTLIAINEFNYRIDEAGLDDEVKVISTIYDSIYTQVIEDPEIIMWVNNNLIPIMCMEYLQDEVIHNEASGEIGYNWADLHRIRNNATCNEIKKIIKLLSKTS